MHQHAPKNFIFFLGIIPHNSIHWGKGALPHILREWNGGKGEGEEGKRTGSKGGEGTESDGRGG